MAARIQIAGSEARFDNAACAWRCADKGIEAALNTHLESARLLNLGLYIPNMAAWAAKEARTIRAKVIQIPATEAAEFPFVN